MLLSQKLDRIYTWFDTPFPARNTTKVKLRDAFLYGLFVFLFLLAFRPFNVDLFEGNIYLFLGGFGFITFCCTAIINFLLPMFFPTWTTPSTWTVGKELVVSCGYLLFISIGNWAYSMLIVVAYGLWNTVEFNAFVVLLYYVFFTCTLGIFPVFLDIFIKERIQFKSFLKNNWQDTKQPEIVISDANQGMIRFAEFNYPLKWESLIVAKAEGNYTWIYHLQDGEMKRNIVRTTLKSIEEQVEDNQQPIRCHKSFLINPLFIKSYTGNSRDFQIEMKHLDFTVPVSRSFPKENLEKLVSVKI